MRKIGLGGELERLLKLSTLAYIGIIPLNEIVGMICVYGKAFTFAAYKCLASTQWQTKNKKIDL